MIAVESGDDLRRELASARHGRRVALVPTMGCLHAGHLRLIRLAKELADTVVVSIYVNPLQFGPAEDFSAYPRPFEDDMRQCREAGVDMLFHPQNLYPQARRRYRCACMNSMPCCAAPAAPGISTAWPPW